MSKQINSRFRNLTIGATAANAYSFPLEKGSENQILKLNASGELIFTTDEAGSAESLADTLAVGNTSGTYSISMNTQVPIVSGNGDGQIDLDAFGSANEILISTDAGQWNGTQPGIYLAAGNTQIFDGGASTGRYSEWRVFNGNAKAGTDGGVSILSHHRMDIKTANTSGTSTNIQILDNSGASKTSTNNAGAVHYNAVFINSESSSAASGVNNSVVIGGSSLSATQDDTVYVPKFNIDSVGTSTATSILAVDANGNVVDGAALLGGEATTASNGLTLSGVDVKLGGTLTGNTIVDTASSTFELEAGTGNTVFKKIVGKSGTNFNIGHDNFGRVLTGGDLDAFYAQANSVGIYSGTNSGGELSLTPSGTFVKYITDSAEFSIQLAETQGVINDTINSKGLIYAGDYESNFTNRSLITKQYVDSAVSGFEPTNADNGLTEVGGTVSLGGTLTSNTTIDGSTGTYDLVLTAGSLYLNGDTDVRIAYNKDTADWSSPLIVSSIGSVDLGAVLIDNGGRIMKSNHKETLGATATDLGSIAMVNGDIIHFTIRVTAMDQPNTKGYTADIKGAYKKVGGTVTLIGAVSKDEYSDFTTASVDLVIDGTAGIKVQLTGEAATTIGWQVDADYSINNIAAG